MNNFCTLFDSNYLTRGLALYESLNKNCNSFHLYVITFDKSAFDFLSASKPPHLTPIALEEFEDAELLKIKGTRSAAEYCWTCTPSVVLYCIEKFKLDACTYLDADMFFFENPQVLFDENPAASVLITSHNYSKIYDQSAISGTYCVQFMYFRNDNKGMRVLKWWRARCLEWCYAYVEDDKFGDQKYLEHWTRDFEGVHVIQNPGAGVAPWNAQRYKFLIQGDKILMQSKLKEDPSTVIFFHFHGLKFFSDSKVTFSGSLYEMNQEVKRIFYFPYIKNLVKISSALNNIDHNIKDHGAKQVSPSRKKVFFAFLRERLVLMKIGKLSPLNFRSYNFAKHYHFYNTELFS